MRAAGLFGSMPDNKMRNEGNMSSEMFLNKVAEGPPLDADKSRNAQQIRRSRTRNTRMRAPRMFTPVSRMHVEFLVVFDDV